MSKPDFNKYIKRSDQLIIEHKKDKIEKKAKKALMGKKDQKIAKK